MTKKIQYNKKIMTKHLFYCNKTLIDFIKISYYLSELKIVLKSSKFKTKIHD